MLAMPTPSEGAPPVRAKSEDLPRFHGTNERISVANHAELIRFYHRLLLNAAGKPEEQK